MLETPKLKYVYANARKARDARFDGVFFVGVKTTGIYCRPICPANSPLERNVEYYPSAITAAESGFRPCLRCRPESAPQSSAWLGTDTSFHRALELIQQGALQNGSVQHLAARLGMSDRYLRALFQTKLGTSPKKLAIYQQCLFAKQLLHDSSLSITDVAFAAGFKSVRRFNEAIKQQIGLSPRDIRTSAKPSASGIEIDLSYRPPYAWQSLLSFLHTRQIPGLEWGDGEHYARTIEYQGTQGRCKGYFSLTPQPDRNRFKLSIYLDDYSQLNPVTQRIRRLFDVDAPIERIDQQLQLALANAIDYQPGLRVPGIWNSFEAGVRAILGQQVSVAAARNLVISLTDQLGEPIEFATTPASRLFPTPAAVANSSLDFFRMPQARKDTIHRLAEHFLTLSENNSGIAAKSEDDIDAWLAIKGIGPWTINYVKMRAAKDPDVWLAGDAGLKNALKTLSKSPDIELMRPWRSYLTMQLWNQL